MRRLVSYLVVLTLVLVIGSGLVQAKPDNGAACWGQATKVFAHTGEMGLHSSSQATPRLGLRNLARTLYEQGVIPDDTMTALGQFVSAELGLSIEACQ